MANKDEMTVARVSEDPADGHDTRLLVDRSWPRGLSKEKADLDEWRSAVVPSTALREW